MSVHDNPENKKLKNWKALGISVAAVAGITGVKTKVLFGIVEDVVETNKTSVDPDFDCEDEYLLGFRIPCGDGTGPYDETADFDITELASDLSVGFVCGLLAWAGMTMYEKSHTRYPVAV